VRLEAVRVEQGQRFDQRWAPISDRSRQLAACDFGVDVVRDLQEHRTRVQPSSIRMIVTPVCLKPLRMPSTGAAAQLREKRWVEVDHAVPREREQLGLEDVAYATTTPTSGARPEALDECRMVGRRAAAPARLRRAAS